jgi:NAD(P)H-dependent FMN reductase
MSIFAMCGSLRAGSLNRQLLDLAARRVKAAGLTVDLATSDDLRLPLYDGDLEAASGLPPGALALKDRITRARLVLIANPEYNSGMTGALKNAIDWVSRPPQNALTDKWVAIVSASPGQFGGIRSALTLRQSLAGMGSWAIPQTLALSKAHEAFDERGELKDPALSKQLDGVVAQIVKRAQ